jgi:hypothetical protein
MFFFTIDAQLCSRDYKLADVAEATTTEHILVATQITSDHKSERCGRRSTFRAGQEASGESQLSFATRPTF